MGGGVRECCVVLARVASPAGAGNGVWCVACDQRSWLMVEEGAIMKVLSFKSDCDSAPGPNNTQTCHVRGSETNAARAGGSPSALQGARRYFLRKLKSPRALSSSSSVRRTAAGAPGKRSARMSAPQTEAVNSGLFDTLIQASLTLSLAATPAKNRKIWRCWSTRLPNSLRVSI